MAGIARASVDGQAVPPEVMGFLQQRDPFPGEHTYWLQLTTAGGLLPKDLRNLSRVLSLADAGQILHAVEWELSRMGYQSTGYAYFINTLEQVESDERSISIAGVCSPVTRSPLG